MSWPELVQRLRRDKRLYGLWTSGEIKPESCLRAQRHIIRVKQAAKLQSSATISEMHGATPAQLGLETVTLKDSVMCCARSLALLLGGNSLGLLHMLRAWDL